jgi:riboflavin kinase/FMN adenylyltransferase
VLLVREELRHSATPGEHALAIGVFDGVHLGHAALVRRMVEEAKQRGLGSGIVTFHPHPISVIRPDTPMAYLESLEHRVELLRDLGVDFVAVLQFTSELQQVSAADFMQLLVEEAGMRLLVAGPDFRVGRRGEGTLGVVREIGEEQGFEVLTIEFEPAPGDGERVSSTRVREALVEGRMEDVSALLGRDFSLRGPVLRGEERGRTLGFPTLNIGVSADRLMPPNGVYVTRAHVGEDVYEACTNIGVQPTFDGTERRVETHLLDFEGDLYGEVVLIELLHRLRGEQKFDGIDALVAQIGRDVEATRGWFS